MSGRYFFEKKIDVSKQGHVSTDVINNWDVPAKLHIDVNQNTINVAYEPKDKTPVLDMEWTLLILNENKSIRKEGLLVTFKTWPEKRLESSILFENEDSVDSHVYLAIKAKATTVKAVIGNTADFPDDDMKITVGKSVEKCLHLSPAIVAFFPVLLKALFEKVRQPHFDHLEIDNLDDFIDLNCDDDVWGMESHNYEKLMRRVILYIKFTGELLDVCGDGGSPRWFVHRNFKSMFKTVRDEKWPWIIICTGGNYKNYNFTKLEAPNWLSAINTNINIATDDESEWALRLFSSTYNGTRYFGFFLIKKKDNTKEKPEDEEKHLLFKHEIILKLTGCIGERNEEKYETLKFHLTPNQFNGQYTLSCPVLTTMEKLEKIGLDHVKATVQLKIRNGKEQVESSHIVTFPGITNFTVKLGTDEIRINREVLYSFSRHFVELSSNGADGADNTVTLVGDDKDSLVDLFRIAYGNSIPLTYDKVGGMLLVAHKYKFVTLVRYFDLMLVFWAKENKLPQTWADNRAAIMEHLPLHELKLYFDKQLAWQQYQSEIKMDEHHDQWLYDLGVLRKPVEEVKVEIEEIKVEIEEVPENVPVPPQANDRPRRTRKRTREC